MMIGILAASAASAPTIQRGKMEKIITVRGKKPEARSQKPEEGEKHPNPTSGFWLLAPGFFSFSPHPLREVQRQRLVERLARVEQQVVHVEAGDSLLEGALVGLEVVEVTRPHEGRVELDLVAAALEVFEQAPLAEGKVHLVVRQRLHEDHLVPLVPQMMDRLDEVGSLVEQI